jgi:hypothetical protein
MDKRRSISKSVRFDVFNRDGFKCRYCGRSQNDGAVLHLDHVLAVARGGSNDAVNLVTACADCNLGKSDKKLLEDAGMQNAPTYGLSFKSDGRCEYQFVIEKMSAHAARVMTFSWIDGSDYEAVTLSRDDIKRRCVLYASRAEFLEAASFWGDLRAKRKNPLFVQKELAQ